MSNGYLVGGYYQWYHNLESKGTPQIVNQWGLVTDHSVFIGQGRRDSSSTQIGGTVTYSWLYLTDQPTVEGALKIVGGFQYFDNDSTEVFAWGNHGSLYYDQEVYQSTAYNDNTSSWEASRIHLYVTPATNDQTPGFRLVGFRQLARDLESKQPYVTVSEWGDTSAQEQFIGIGKAWSQAYGWGFSQISLFLAPA